MPHVPQRGAGVGPAGGPEHRRERRDVVTLAGAPSAERGADEPGVVTERSHGEARHRAVGQPRGHRRRERIEQCPLGPAQPAADHDHTGIDHGDGVGEGDGERPDGVVPDLDGVGIAGGREAHDAGRVDGRVGRATAASVAIGDGAGRGHLLQRHRRAIRIGWFDDARLADLAGLVGGADDGPSLDEHGGGDAGADGDEQRHRLAGRRAERRLGAGRGADIVLQGDRRGGDGRQPLGHRDVVPAERRRRHADPGHLVHDAGDVHPGGDHVEAGGRGEAGEARRVAADVVDHRLPAALTLGGDAFEQVQTAGAEQHRP